MEEENQIVNDRSMELFVGNNYEYYKNKWHNKQNFENFASWNWPAFFFPVYWLAYRKMYLEAFLYGLLSLFFMIIPGSGLILHIVSGIFTNSYYHKNWLKIVAKTSKMTESESEQYISKHGGTSVLNIFITILVTIFLASAIVAGVAFLPTEENKIQSEIVELKTFKTNDLTFSFPNDWKLNEDENPYELECISQSGNLVTGIFVYEKIDFAKNTIPEDILDLQIDEIQLMSKNIKFIEKIKDEVIGDKRIKTVIYSSEEDGMKYYYILSLVEFKEFEKFTIIVQTCMPSDFEKYKSTLGDIVSSCTRL
ncbi:MAG: DUF2628 domain-containing protein [Cellulosilyticaceae bacterium]